MNFIWETLILGSMDGIVRFKCVIIPVSDAVIVSVLKDGTLKGARP